MRFLLGSRAYVLTGILTGILFTIHFYILAPTNFSSFSDTLRYFISALSTLLAVVVSFNTLALRNQLKNMPTTTENLERQLDKVSDLVRSAAKYSGKSNGGDWQKPGHNPTLYYSDAIQGTMVAAQEQAQLLAGKSPSKQEKYREISGRIQTRLMLYSKYDDPYYLVSISTTPLVEQLRFHDGKAGPEEKEERELFETAKRLHLLRNIGIRIYIRNALTRLSRDMLAFTIPIITLAAVVSAISNYSSYDTALLRILFAASISTVTLPFLLLFARTWPLLQLISRSSSIPFADRKST